MQSKDLEDLSSCHPTPGDLPDKVSAEGRTSIHCCRLRVRVREVLQPAPCGPAPSEVLSSKTHGMLRSSWWEIRAMKGRLDGPAQRAHSCSPTAPVSSCRAQVSSSKRLRKASRGQICRQRRTGSSGSFLAVLGLWSDSIILRSFLT